VSTSGGKALCKIALAICSLARRTLGARRIYRLSLFSAWIGAPSMGKIRPSDIVSRRSRRSAIPLSFVLIAFGACATHQTTFHASSMDFGSIQRVAVLPFANLTRENTAGERIRDVLVTMLLASEAFEVVPKGELARALQRTGVRDATAPSKKQLLQLGKMIDVDAIFTGAVREYGELRSGQATANVAAISLRLQETQTGMIIWSASSTQGGVGFWDRLLGGGGRPMNKVSEDVVGSMLDALFNVQSKSSSSADDDEDNDDAEPKKESHAKTAKSKTSKSKSDRQKMEEAKAAQEAYQKNKYKKNNSPGSE